MQAAPYKKFEEGLVTAKLPSLVAREAHAGISVNMAGRLPMSRPFNGLTCGLSEQISSELAPLVENALVEAMYKVGKHRLHGFCAHIRAMWLMLILLGFKYIYPTHFVFHLRLSLGWYGSRLKHR